MEQKEADFKKSAICGYTAQGLMALTLGDKRKLVSRMVLGMCFTFTLNCIVFVSAMS